MKQDIPDLVFKFFEGVRLSIPCPHQTCNSNDALWLPRLADEHNNEVTVKKGQLGLHHYCTCCGLVKVDGDGRGRKEGFFISLLSALSAHLAHNRTGEKLTKVDVRLICAEIRERDIFTDPYGSRREAQERALVDIIMERRGDLDGNFVREFVREYGIVRKTKRPRST